jgi:predicted nucleic acid-binding protein
LRAALDTNILAYAEGLGDETRCNAALQLVPKLPTAASVLPAQTLGELTRVLVGKAGRSPSAARAAVLGWADSFAVGDSSWSAFQAALDLVVDHHLPIWDALILAVAAENRCRLLLSEDFHNGLTWRGVTVVNPFAPQSSPLLAGLLAH